MECLPFGLGSCILQHNGIVFPTDEDQIKKDYDQLLEHAILKNLLGYIRTLLRVKQCNNPKAVLLSVQYGTTECLQLLIEANCPIDETAIDHTVICGNIPSLKLLMQDEKLLRRRYFILLNNAVKYNQPEHLKILLDYIVSPDLEVEVMDTRYGRIECLDRDIHDINISERPLHFWFLFNPARDILATREVAKNGYTQCLRLLLDADCETDSYTLWWAVINNHIECVRMLIEAKCPIHSEAINGAISNGNIDCVKLLLEANCPKTSNAIYQAAIGGQTECLKLLIASKYEMSFHDIYIAARYGHIECLKLLIQAKCPIHPFAIQEAEGNGHHECVALLKSI